MGWAGELVADDPRVRRRARRRSRRSSTSSLDLARAQGHVRAGRELARHPPAVRRDPLGARDRPRRMAARARPDDRRAPRPISFTCMDDASLMTAADHAALSAELAELEGEGRRAIAQRIKTAREWGDLKENSEYHDAKNDQAHLETKIARAARAPRARRGRRGQRGAARRRRIRLDRARARRGRPRAALRDRQLATRRRRPRGRSRPSRRSRARCSARPSAREVTVALPRGSRRYTVLGSTDAAAVGAARPPLLRVPGAAAPAAGTRALPARCTAVLPSIRLRIGPSPREPTTRMSTRALNRRAPRPRVRTRPLPRRRRGRRASRLRLVELLLVGLAPRRGRCSRTRAGSATVIAASAAP